MMNQQSKKQFSFEDIQRYLDGAMNPAEKHELERAALQDPFLADALEGFEKQGTISYKNHQEEIAISISKERKTAPIIPISKRMSWMRIAALFILIAGVGLIGYQNFKPGKTEVVASHQEIGGKKDVLPESTLPETQKKIPQTESTLPKATKNNNTIHHENAIVNVKEKQEDRLRFTPNPPDVVVEILTGDELQISATMNNTDARDDIASTDYFKAKELERTGDSIKPFLPSNTIEEQLAGKEAGVQVGTQDHADSKKVGHINMLQGIISDESGKPLANVSVISADKKNVVITDLHGKFSLIVRDSSNDATVAAVGYLTAQVKLNDDAARNQFVLAPAASKLDEVVVTSLGISRERKSLNYSVDKSGEALQPIGGWESFHEYVRIKLGMDSLEYYREVPGEEMTVEFTLDKEGNPLNVQILSNQGSEKADVVRKIILAGPRWTKPEKRKKVRTTIPRS